MINKITPSIKLLFCLIQCLVVVTVQAKNLTLHFMTASAEVYNEPHDIVLSPDGNKLYVADNSNDRIAVLDPKTLKLLGTFAEDEVSAPHDVVFDSQGRLLVADTGNDRIAIYQVIGVSGRLVDELKDRIRRPEGVTAHADGRVLATGAASDNLVVYRNKKVVQETGGFSSPHDVAFGPSGAIWIADANNDRIIQLNSDLEVIQVLEGAPYDFNGPRYLDFDAQGRLYVADKYSNQIKIIDQDGHLLHVLGTRKSGKGANVFDRPEGVEIHGKDVWFSDTYNDRIVRYRME